MFTRPTALAFVAFTAACTQGLLPVSLESAEVESTHWSDAEEASSVTGVLEVDGADRDFAITVVTGEQDVELMVHSPGQTDFNTFDGMELTLMPVMSWSGHLTGLSLSEGDTLHYGLVGADGNPEVAQALGADFASYGPEYSSSTEDGFDYTWHPVRFATDEGHVDVMPSETAEIVVDGASWHVRVIAAYTEEARPNTPVPGCGGGGDLLSYEIERVSEETGEQPEWLDRPEGMDMAARVCG